MHWMPNGESVTDPALEQIEQIDDLPDEEDAYISPSGPLGSRTSASFGGKFLGEYEDDKGALAAIREAADSQQFWPNIWSVSDHGNVHGPISY